MGKRNRPYNCVCKSQAAYNRDELNKNQKRRIGDDVCITKFCHYLLGGNLKMFSDHSALKYLVNKPVLGLNICRWLLLSQEFDFDIIVKLGRLNPRPDHISRIELGK